MFIKFDTHNLFFSLMGISNEFKRLLKNSVVPGLPQLAKTRNVGKRALKFIVFVGCTVGFLWQTFEFLDVYWSYPTVVDVESEFLEYVHLPAVTVCSHNGYELRNIVFFYLNCDNSKIEHF